MKPHLPYQANDFAKHFSPPLATSPPPAAVPTKKQFSKVELYTILGLVLTLLVFTGLHFIQQAGIMKKLDGINGSLADLADQGQLKITEEILLNNQTTKNATNVQSTISQTDNEKV